MKFRILLLAILVSGAVHAGPDASGDFSATCTLTEKRQVAEGLLIPTKTAPQRIKVHYRDGGFLFQHRGITYSSPRLDAQGLASTPKGQQYRYAKDDQAFSVADGETYFELARCLTAAPAANMQLKGAVSSPAPGVICDRKARFCADAQGISLGLTKAYLGAKAEATMLSRINGAGGPANYDLTWFGLSNGVDCKTQEKVCHVAKHSDQMDAAHTHALFGR